MVKSFPTCVRKAIIVHKTPSTVWPKHGGEALGFKYMSASSKQEYLERLPEFLTTQSDSPIILECHTTPDDDSQAGGALQLLDQDYVNKKKLKDAIKNVVPDSMLRTAKTILSRK